MISTESGPHQYMFPKKATRILEARSPFPLLLPKNRGNYDSDRFLVDNRSAVRGKVRITCHGSKLPFQSPRKKKKGVGQGDLFFLHILLLVCENS